MTADEEKISKSERKRQHEFLQKLGESLIRLKSSDLDDLPIPDSVREAVVAAKSIRQHGALRRQRQYIGKLMRDVDPRALQAALTELHQPAVEEIRVHHAAEQWRDRLLRQGDDALRELLQAHPQADRQLLHSLLRSALGCREDDPQPSRALYRALRQLFTDQ